MDKNLGWVGKKSYSLLYKGIPHLHRYVLKADIYRPPEIQDVFPFSRLPCSSLFNSQHVPFLHPLCACSLSCPSCLSHCHHGDVLPPLLFASKTIGPILQSELFANILSLSSQVNAMLQSEPPLLSLKFM